MIRKVYVSVMLSTLFIFIVKADGFKNNATGLSKYFAPWQELAFILVNIGLLFWVFAIVKKLINSKAEEGVSEIVGWVISVIAANILIYVIPNNVYPITK